MNNSQPPMSNPHMRALKYACLTAVLLVAGCAGVSTQVVPFNPAQVYPPTTFVEVLLEKPKRPHVEIALIESRGGSEANLLNDARQKAREIGADAIVRIDTERHYHPPVTVYDPWHDPFYWGPPFRHRYYAPFGPWVHPWGPYRVIPGAYEYVLKATAVRYTDKAG